MTTLPKLNYLIVSIIATCTALTDSCAYGQASQEDADLAWAYATIAEMSAEMSMMAAGDLKVEAENIYGEATSKYLLYSPWMTPEEISSYSQAQIDYWAAAGQYTQAWQLADDVYDDGVEKMEEGDAAYNFGDYTVAEFKYNFATDYFNSAHDLAEDAYSDAWIMYWRAEVMQSAVDAAEMRAMME